MKTGYQLWTDNYIPEITVGDWSIDHFEVTRDAAIWSMMRRDPVDPGHYMKLSYKGRVVMSNTRMEYSTNVAFFRYAVGDVFIGGLGMGLIIRQLLARDEVKSVTVVEQSPEVIQITSPHLKDKRLKIIEGDVKLYRPDTKYDSIWFDIWNDRSSDNLPEMSTLHRRWAKWWTRQGPRGSWSQKEMQAMVRRDRQYSWR